MKTWKMLYASIALVFLSSSAVWSQPNSTVTVKDLRVEYLKNPVGIDVAQPRFSWKIESSDRGVRQTAYEISVSTQATGEDPIWNSGEVASDKSVHIEYAGPALAATTRYYWTVSIWDQDSQKISSTESAFFETGLLETGWGDAKWIKVPSNTNAGLPAKYSLEMKFEIAKAAAGPIFGAKDKNNFYMWQINIEKTTGHTFFRPHVWRNGGPTLLNEVDITDIINVEKNTEYTLRIDVDGTSATTYINDLKIDERQNSDDENFYCGLFGFRSAGAEHEAGNEDAFYDDIKIITVEEGEPVVFLEETFSGDSSPFLDAPIVDGRLHVAEGKIAWQKSQRDYITKYTVEMDFEIEDVAAGPIFGAKSTNTYFMWQINVEQVSGKTTFRPHSWLNGGGANHEDKDITSLIDIQRGQVYHLKIVVDGDKASTYIDNILVDADRVNPRGGNYGFGDIGLGFRADFMNISGRGEVTEKSYFDNIVVTAEINGGNPEVFFSENFSDPENYAFSYGIINNGRLYVPGRNYSWQTAISTSDLHFIVDADLTLLNDNAAIIFAAKNTTHFYMWAFNTFNSPNGLILRRHFYDGGNPAYTDVEIGGLYPRVDLLSQERHIKIEAVGGNIKTYIEGVLVDTYKDPYGQLIPGGLGFRAYKETGLTEISRWDNIVLTNFDENRQPIVVFSENFENGNSFDGGEVVDVAGNKKLHMESRNGDTRAFDDSSNGIPMFRSEFALDKTISSARIYTSALGVYDVFINGKRVGTPVGAKTIYDEFKPGWTDYKKTVFYSTYDVKDLLQQGDNAIGAYVSSGWWQGAVSHGEYGNPNLGFIAKLVVNYTDGSSEVVVTKPDTWKASTDSPVRIGDIYAGETYDARKENNWTSVGFDDSEWANSVLNNNFTGKIKAFVGPTVQVRPELQRSPIQIVKYEGTVNPNNTNHGMIDVKTTLDAPASVVLNKGQTVIYDLGQNMVGWVKFKVKGAAGTKLTIRFAEMLNDEGKTSRGDDGPGGSLYLINLRGAKATLYYTLKGDPQGEEFHPSTSFFGFRYADIVATENVEIESLVGEVVGTAAEEGSSFSTSHAAVNQLYNNVVWGQRGNFLSIPTDCPQRDERLGWTGDIQVFGRTATYNADLAAFFHKWMGDMRDSQRADGAYPDVAPHSWVGYGNAAWAEAGITTPWTTYLMYNDRGILEENYASMEKYMDWLSRQTGDGYNYNGAGTAYGDWVSYVNTDSRYISVCYYAYAALLMEKISKALSVTDDDEYAQKVAAYQTLYNNIKAEFLPRYAYSNGRLRQETQTTYLLALKLGLYASESARQYQIDALKKLIKDNGNKLNTGFVGTGIINQTLSDVGLTDVAYNLLLQRNNPSWLYSVDQGATTIWERWNSYTIESGFHPDITMNSFNHYANGAVAEWMYRYVTGINPDESNPGFKHILLKPSPDFRTARPAGQVQITKAEATYNSYYGQVKSAWEIVENAVKYNVSVPANTTATLTLILSSEQDNVVENETPAADVEGVTSFRIENNKAILELQSGDYLFEVQTGTEMSIKNPVNNGNVVIYPNPVEDWVNFKTGDEDAMNIKIFNNTGLLVYSQQNNAAVNIKSFAAGIYFVQVDTKKGSTVVKIEKV